MLRELRKKRGFTQKQLSEKSGVSQSRISELEKGNNLYLANIQTIILLANALDSSLDELCSFNEKFKGKPFSKIFKEMN